jgi:hypothetical protein
MPFDTTSDTTQRATRRNVEQPSARKSAYLCWFCNVRQRLETVVGGLWLATHISVNAMNAGLASPEDHIEAIRRYKEALRA